MTKKDYIIIANAFAKAFIDISDLEKNYPAEEKLKQQKIGVERARDYIMSELYANNTKFSDDKFIDFIVDRVIELKK